MSEGDLTNQSFVIKHHKDAPEVDPRTPQPYPRGHSAIQDHPLMQKSVTELRCLLEQYGIKCEGETEKTALVEKLINSGMAAKSG